jgi:hypothetical protein
MDSASIHLAAIEERERDGVAAVAWRKRDYVKVRSWFVERKKESEGN